MKRQQLKCATTASLLAAMSIIFGKFFAFNIGDTVRISFENLPLIIAGIGLGPLWGAATALVADLVGCLAVGYTINPVITLGAVVIGSLSAILFRLFNKLPLSVSVGATVILVHLLGSVVIKTAGLAWFYGTSFTAMLPYRLLNYALIIVFEYTIIYILMKNRAISRIIENLGGKEKS